MSKIFIKEELPDDDLDDDDDDEDEEDDDDEDEEEREGHRKRRKRKRHAKNNGAASFTFISCSNTGDEAQEDDLDEDADSDDDYGANEASDDYDSDEPLAKKAIKKIKTEFIKKEPKYKKHYTKKLKHKRNRKKVTLRMKLDILKRFESGDRPTDISNALSLPCSTIRTIIKDADNIKRFSEKACSLNATCLVKNNRNFLMIQMENELVDWLKRKRIQDLQSNLSAIQNKAKKIFEELKSNSSNPEDKFISFKASTGWFERFKRRADNGDLSGKHKSERSRMMRALTDNSMLKKYIDDGGYTPHQIFNVDEIGLFWKRFPLVTGTKGKEASMYRSTLDRFSLLLCSNASGDLKLKPLVVYQSITPKCMKNVKVESLPVIYKTNKKALITAGVFEDWFYSHFCPTISEYFKMNNLPMKALLILDSAPCHPPYIAEQHNDVKVFILPPTCSATLQPFEQGVWTRFKLLYHRNLFNEAANALERELFTTFKLFWLEYSAKSAIEAIAKVWDEIRPEDLTRSWKKLYPDCTVNLPDVNVEAELDDVKAEVIELGKRIGYDELDLKGIHELLDSHNQECSFQELKDMEYEKLVLETYNETRKEQQRILTAKSIKRAIQHFETAMALLNEHDPVKERCANLHAIVNYAINCYQDLCNNDAKNAADANVSTVNDGASNFYAPDLEAGCSGASLL